jgi:NADH-quinone oxidoreductase subunit L
MDYQTIQSTSQTLSTLLAIAWLLPLIGFSIEIFAGYWGGANARRSKAAAYLAVFCIATGFVCSSAALLTWGSRTGWVALESHDPHHGEEHAGDSHQAGAHSESKSHDAGHHADAAHGEKHDEHAEADHAKADHAKSVHADEKHDDHAAHLPVQTVFSGTFYQLAKFGDLSIGIDYYIDSLTLVMFTMVTFIATCIHLFAIGYMSDELTEEYVDHQVHTGHGHHVHRPGRFYRFFAFLSLFCFSMLGLVLAGNIFQVFMFWELVGSAVTS